MPKTPEFTIDDVRSWGCVGECDYDGGCTAAAEWVIAEDCPASGPLPHRLLDDPCRASVAVYCGEHLAGAPIASREEVVTGARVFTGPAWERLLDTYPEPLRIAEADEGGQA